MAATAKSVHNTHHDVHMSVLPSSCEGCTRLDIDFSPVLGPTPYQPQLVIAPPSAYTALMHCHHAHRQLTHCHHAHRQLNINEPTTCSVHSPHSPMQAVPTSMHVMHSCRAWLHDDPQQSCQKPCSRPTPHACSPAQLLPCHSLPRRCLLRRHILE